MASIVPVGEKWIINIKEERSRRQLDVSIEQDATVRKLYKEARKAFGVTTAIELRIQSGAHIVKDDRRLRTAGITGSTKLLLRILRGPDTFTIFVTLPGRQDQSTFNICETDSLRALYTMVKEKDPTPEIRLEFGSGVCIEDKNDKKVCNELFDGASLIARYEKITVYVTSGSSDTRNFAVNVPLRYTIKQFFDEILSRLPANHSDFRLIDGQKEFAPDDTNMTLADLNIKHQSTVLVIARFKGGEGDCNQNCGLVSEVLLYHSDICGVCHVNYPVLSM